MHRLRQTSDRASHETRLATSILEGSVKEGDRVLLRYDAPAKAVRVEKRPAEKKPRREEPAHA